MFCVPVILKSELPKEAIRTMEIIKALTKRRIVCIRTDNGTEFVNATIAEWCEKNSIIHQRSCVYTPSENGKAERTVRTFKHTMMAILATSQLKKSFWCYAAEYAAHIINSLPKKNNIISPFEKMFL